MEINRPQHRPDTRPRDIEDDAVERGLAARPGTFSGEERRRQRMARGGANSGGLPRENSYPPAPHPSSGSGYYRYADDLVVLSCGDYVRRFAAMTPYGCIVLLGVAMLAAATYTRYFSTVGKLYRALDTSRPYCEGGEDCEETIIEIESMIDIACLVAAGLGLTFVIFSAFGYRAASQKDSCCLRTQVFFIVAVLLLQLGAGIGLALMKDKAIELFDAAWELDLGVRARIGKGQNERKVLVPPMKCAIQEGLGCYGYATMLKRDNEVMRMMMMGGDNGGYYHPSSVPGGEGVNSCSGAVRPPSGGLMADTDATTESAIRSHSPYDNLGTDQPKREICCPTPAQRVMPKIQFEPMDSFTPLCSEVIPSSIFQYRVYIISGIVTVLCLEIFLIYLSSSLADSIAQSSRPQPHISDLAAAAPLRTSSYNNAKKYT